MINAIAPRLLFDGDRMLENHAVLVENGHVVEVCSCDSLPEGLPLHTLTEGTLAPGFVDVQVNGGGGVMLNNAPSPQTVNKMVAGHRAYGTTGMMPTLISDTRNRQQAGIDAVRGAQADGNLSVLGIHIEGPFFDREKRGTHKASMIREPTADDIDWLCSLDDLETIVTLAPDHTQPGQIRRLAQAGVLVCAGHTNASYAQVTAALEEGLRGFTHLFNAMNPLAAREPGTVGAALDDDHAWVGIIADGYHVHPANIRLAHRSKPAGKLLLVTDAMATVGGQDSFFEIYGERIEQRDGKLVNAEGVLAGSAIGMIDAVRIASTRAGLPLEECLRMASLYPATFLRREAQFGRIAPGYRADLVHFDQEFKVHSTWVAGQRQSH